MVNIGIAKGTFTSILVIVLIVSSFTGCFGVDTTQNNTDKPPILALDKSEFFHYEMILHYNVVSEKEYAYDTECGELVKYGSDYQIRWWLEGVNTGKLDSAPDASVSKLDEINFSARPTQIIDGIVFPKGSATNITSFENSPYPSTKGIIDELIFGDILLPFITGLPSIEDIVGDFTATQADHLKYYPARLKLECDFQDQALNRLFGSHRIEVPFGIELPLYDGNHYDFEGTYNISFFIPVWSLISHHVNVRIWSGYGKAGGFRVAGNDSSQSTLSFIIENADELLKWLSPGFVVYSTIFNDPFDTYHSSCRDRYDSFDERFRFYWDWYYDKMYDYNYIVNGV